jgi:hypothetical protein
MLQRLRQWVQRQRTHKTAVAHGDVFTLHRGNDLLGRIVLRAELCDFPWYGGEFQAEPAFLPLEPLFREELRLLGEEEMDTWGEVWRQIDGPSLRLASARGAAPVFDPTMHIENGVAWWRS